MKMILIITFILGKGAVDISGSVAMAEFDSVDSCRKAKKEWVSRVEKDEAMMNENSYIAMCVKK